MTLADQVLDALARNNITVTTDEDGSGYRVISSSAEVYIAFGEVDGAPTVFLRAPVLTDVPNDGEALVKALGVVNECNSENMFAKFCLYVTAPDDGLIMLQHDLYGSDLQAEELLFALDRIDRMTAQFAHTLRDELGGTTYQERLRREGGAGR